MRRAVNLTAATCRVIGLAVPLALRLPFGTAFPKSLSGTRVETSWLWGRDAPAAFGTAFIVFAGIRPVATRTLPLAD